MQLITKLFALILIAKTISTEENTETECIIYGTTTHTYLYSTNKEALSQKLDRSLYDIFTFTHKYDFNSVNGDTSGQWIFEPVVKRQNVYYLRNSKTNKYLQASEDFEYFLYLKTNDRFVYTTKKESQNLDESYMWRIQNSNNAYKIYSVKYDEPLYTYYLRKSFPVTTPVYCSHKDSAFKFDWKIKCKNDFTP